MYSVLFLWLLKRLKKSLLWEYFQTRSSAGSLKPLIAWRHCVTHTQPQSSNASFWVVPSWSHGEFCSEHCICGKECIELRCSRYNRSSPEQKNAVLLVSATLLHRNRELSAIMLSVAEWVDWRRTEQDTAWILPVLTWTNTTVSLLSVYTSIKAMALSSMYLTPTKISPDRESFILSWDFTAETTRMSEKPYMQLKKSNCKGRKKSFWKSANHFFQL